MQIKEMIEKNSPNHFEIEVKGAFFKQQNQGLKRDRENQEYIALNIVQEKELSMTQKLVEKAINSRLTDKKPVKFLSFLPSVSLSTERELVDLDKRDIISDLNRKIDLSRSKFIFERRISPCY